MSLRDPECEFARLFATLTVANLAMSERPTDENAVPGLSTRLSPAAIRGEDIDIKEQLLKSLRLEFFFPSRGAEDIVSLRTSALSLSELFECDANRDIRRLEEKSSNPLIKKELLELLIRLAASEDASTSYCAVKCLALLASVPANREILLYNCILEAFYDASLLSDKLQTLTYAWQGMMALAENTEEIISYANYGAPQGTRLVEYFEPPIKSEFEVSIQSNTTVSFPTFRYHLPITKGKIYAEVRIGNGGLLQLGVAASSWSPESQGWGVGDSKFGYGIDGKRGCGWHSGSVPIHGPQFKWIKNSVIGILVDYDDRLVSFTLDGQQLGLSFTESATEFRWDDHGGLVFACSFGYAQSAFFNFGHAPFTYKPSGYSSIFETAATISKAQVRSLPHTMQIWRFSTNSWQDVIADDEYILNYRERVSEDIRRTRVVTWLLFSKSLPSDDNFFTKGITVESPHPVKGKFLKAIKRPGASAMTVQVKELLLSKDFVRKEEVCIFEGSRKLSLIKKFNHLERSSAPRPIHIYSDAVTISAKTDKETAGMPGWGCSLFVIPRFGKNILSLREDELEQEVSKRKRLGESITKSSDHPYDNSMNTPLEKVELPGAEAIQVSFDPQTATERNYDYLQFFLDEQGTQQIGQNLSGEAGSGWPGVGGSDPLLIPAPCFWFKFVSDASRNDWGYEFTCIPGQLKVNSLSHKPGYVKITHSDFQENKVVKVSVNGYYHAALGFNENNLLADNEVLEIFLEDPSENALTLPFAMISSPAFQYPVLNAPECDRGHRTYISSYCSGLYSNGYSCSRCQANKYGERWICFMCQYNCCFDCSPKTGALDPSIKRLVGFPQSTVFVPKDEFWIRLSDFAVQAFPKVCKEGHALHDVELGSSNCVQCGDNCRAYGKKRWMCVRCNEAYCFRCLPCESPEISNFSLCAYRAADPFVAAEFSDGAKSFETSHPYGNNEDLVWEIDISDLPVDRLTDELPSWSVCIAFDPASVTEHNCDYVTFWNADPREQGQDLRQYGDRISGDFSSMPSIDNPLEIHHTGPSPKIFGRFISDASRVG